MRGPARDQLPAGLERRLPPDARSLVATATTSHCPGDGQIAMLVGDASGKGVAAALMMASVQASLRTAAKFTGNNLTALLRVVNDYACASSLAARYATLFYGVLDRAALTLRYVNAGHNPPVVLAW